MTKSKILFYLCLSFIAGIFLGSLADVKSSYLSGLLFLFSLAFLFFLFLRQKNFAFFAFCLIVAVLGLWREQTCGYNPRNNGLEKYINSQVVLAGKITEEPAVKQDSAQIVINAQKILLEGKIVSVFGKILIKTQKYPEYNYSGLLVAEGELTVPQNFEGFNYQEYLARKGILATMDWPKIEIIAKENYSNVWQYIYGNVLKFKNKIRETINQNFSFIQGQLLSGILLGDQASFTSDFADKLNITGLRHITAISGMNIAILTSVLMSLFLGVGLWRKQAFYLTLLVIFLFVLMVGFQASVIRAATMASIALFAQRMGRMSASARVIVIAGTIMLLLNPMLLRWDVGFQLSFLAMLGIILLTKPIEGMLKFVPPIINLRGIVATTLSAQVFTLPILIYNFGRISLVSPFTNVLVVPTIDLVMIFGFIFALLGSVWRVFGWLFAWPCWLMLEYIVGIINIFSSPWMARSIENMHWIWLVVLYSLLAVLVTLIKRKERTKFLEY